MFQDETHKAYASVHLENRVFSFAELCNILFNSILLKHKENPYSYPTTIFLRYHPHTLGGKIEMCVLILKIQKGGSSHRGAVVNESDWEP